MMQEGKLSSFEGFTLLMFMISAKVFFTNLSIIIQSFGTAAWYGTLISCIVNIILFYFLYLLLKRFPNKNLVEIFEAVTGKVIGKILSMLFVAYLLYFAASMLREFIEMIKTYNLPYTPPSIIAFLFIVVVCIYAYVGLQGIAKISTLVFFPLVFFHLLILLLSIPHFEPDYLKPWLGHDPASMFQISFLRSSAYNEVFVLAFLSKSFPSSESVRNIGFAASAFTGFILSITCACILMVYSYTMGSEALSGFFQLSRNIYFNRFFQRMESIFLFMWVIASLIAVTLAFYVAMSTYCKVFPMENHRPLILPFSFLLFGITFLPNSLAEVIHTNLLFINQYSLFFVYGIPFAVLLLSFFKGNKKRKELVYEKNT